MNQFFVIYCFGVVTIGILGVVELYNNTSINGTMVGRFGGESKSNLDGNQILIIDGILILIGFFIFRSGKKDENKWKDIL